MLDTPELHDDWNDPAWNEKREALEKQVIIASCALADFTQAGNITMRGDNNITITIQVEEGDDTRTIN